jgi:16S rRNA (cytidine1402-2'-O)-methyltransferase
LAAGKASILNDEQNPAAQSPEQGRAEIATGDHAARNTQDANPTALEAGIIAALSSTVRDLFARRLAAGLHLVATPIGNLGDISPRGLTTIALADHAYCEDTRISRPMLARFSINRRLAVYQEHNAETARKEILAIIAAGGSVALISDAGSPAISDPGFKLARAVIAAGGEVFAVPGPTALAAAVTISGLPTDAFFFAGFLPQKSTARRTRITALRDINATLVFYESPHRISAALTDLAELLGDRDAAVTREITKKFEEVRRGTLAELAEWSATTPPRGEIAIVVGPPAGDHAVETDDATILAEAKEMLAELRPAAAAKAIAQKFGVPRARVYDLILTLKNT